MLFRWIARFSFDFIVDDSDIKSVGLQVGVHGVQSNKVYYQLNAVDTSGDAKENAVTQDDDNNYDDGQSQDSNSDRNASNSGQNSDNDGTYDTSGDDRYDEQQNAGSPIVQDYEITLDSLSGNRKVGNSIYGAKVKVDRYELLDFAKGAGYTVTPTVTITGGGGVGAAATAQLITSGLGVIRFSITDPGVGFGTAPTITIDGPPINAAPVAVTVTTTVPDNFSYSIGETFDSELTRFDQELTFDKNS